jgi:hypothetical protein
VVVAVLTVKVTVVAPALDATVAGVKLDVAPAGVPLAANVTLAGYAFAVGAICSEYVAEAPAWIV